MLKADDFKEYKLVSGFIVVKFKRVWGFHCLQIEYITIIYGQMEERIYGGGTKITFDD